MAPALRVLTWPFLAITILMLGRGWYPELTHRHRWRLAWATRARLVLIGSTGLAVSLWGLRLAGLVGTGLF